MKQESSIKTGQGLYIEGVSHSYGRHRVFSGVSLSVGRGEVVSLLGPSGCGKTTLLRLAAGLEEVQEGQIRIGNRLVAGEGLHTPPEGRNLGLVLQDYALFPHLSVIDNVAFGLKERRAEGAADRALEMLRRVGMDEHADKYPHMLSGGEQQRIALARALATEPGVMLMDEPFSGLDADRRNRVRDETLSLLKSLEVPTLLVTHDPEEAMRLSDRIAYLRGGALVQSGTPYEIYNQPVDPAVVALFGEANRIPGTVADGGVATPFGTVPAPRFENGRAVEVYIRAEGFALDEQGIEVTAKRQRLLGAEWLIEVETPDGDKLDVRLPVDDVEEEIGRLRLVLRPGKAYVFPRSG